MLIAKTSSYITSNALVINPITNRATATTSRRTLTRRGSPTTLFLTPTEELETLSKVWTNRRQLIRSTLASSHKIRSDALSNDSETSENPISQAVIYTTFAAVFSSIIIRVGGRTALIGGLGLAPPSDLDSGGILSDVITTVQSLSVTPGDASSYVHAALTLAPLWIGARVFMFDYLAIPLALLSGVIFQNVLLGGIISSILSTTGSIFGFLIGRYSPVGTKVLDKISGANPVVKAVGKTVEGNPIKAVLVARLAPVLPIPIGAYNYVYGGLTKVSYGRVVAFRRNSLNNTRQHRNFPPPRPSSQSQSSQSVYSSVV